LHISNKNNPKLIFISGLNKKHFAVPILNFLSKKIELSISESKYNFIHKIRAENKNIIWVEWARKHAKYFSHKIHVNQKLFIRLHRYEINDEVLLKQINWSNVHTVIFVNSEIEKEFNEKNFNVNTVTIPNAINTSIFKIKNITEKNSLLAYGQHYNSIKAYDKLINLFVKIIEKDPSFSLTIANQKPIKENHKQYFDLCNNLIYKYGLTNKINLLQLDHKNELDKQSNIIKLIHNHNAIISYSDIESFHYAFAEGLLCGLQGFCNGWRKLNPNEFWHTWCYDNQEKMINAILNWGQLSHYERNIISKKNRTYIINNFSSQVIGEKYFNLFL